MSQSTISDADTDTAPRSSNVGYLIVVRIAGVCGVFALVVCALLLYDFSRRTAQHPLDSAAYDALRQSLSKEPEDEALQQEIREYDLKLQEEFFRQRAFTVYGSWLLLASAALGVMAAATAATLRRRLPMPSIQPTAQDVETQWTRIGRWAVAGLGLLLAVGTLGLNVAFPSRLPQSQAALEKMLAGKSDGESAGNGGVPAPNVVEIVSPPTEEELAKMWSRFRGPQGSGISTHADVPTSWDGNTGEGILWKKPIPLPGFNSPIVVGKRVFICGATEGRREVYCFHADTGALRWKKDVPGDPNRPGEPVEPEFSGYAAPTMATNGKQVFAIFVNGDLAAFDLGGNQLWAKSLGFPQNSYGHASSLETYQNLVLVQIDYGETVNKTDAKLYAFDGQTGNVAWEVDRPVTMSWTSPIVIDHAGAAQLITCSDPWTIAYNPADGKEIWRAKVTPGECGPSPVYANGLIYVGNEYCVFSVLSPDGKGDLTADEETTQKYVKWTGEDGLPDTCSPLVTDQLVLLMPTTGYLTCLDAASGELLWDHEFDAEFTASPSLAGGLVYHLGEVDDETEEDEEGYPVKKATMWILKVDREKCEVVGQCELGEGCVASPAFQDGRIYLRGKKHLFCIGK